MYFSWLWPLCGGFSAVVWSHRRVFAARRATPRIAARPVLAPWAVPLGCACVGVCLCLCVGVSVFVQCVVCLCGVLCVVCLWQQWLWKLVVIGSGGSVPHLGRSDVHPRPRLLAMLTQVGTRSSGFT